MYGSGSNGSKNRSPPVFTAFTFQPQQQLLTRTSNNSADDKNIIPADSVYDSKNDHTKGK